MWSRAGAAVALPALLVMTSSDCQPIGPEGSDGETRRFSSRRDHPPTNPDCSDDLTQTSRMPPIWKGPSLPFTSTRTEVERAYSSSVGVFEH